MAEIGAVSKHFPRIVPCGDSAVVVELSDEIDEETSRQVVAIAAGLASDPIAGIAETVPTYRSLLVVYDPEIIRGRALAALLRERLTAVAPAATGSRRLVVPVVYGGETGLDLEEMAETKGLSVEQLIELHSQARFRVYMIGFAPGFAYLGGLPEILHTPRRAVPRQRIEAGAIGIGGKQASINSVPGPSGWHFIGRTPVKVFDPMRATPFLLKAGDEVRFRRIDETEAGELDAVSAAGTLDPEWEQA